MSNASPKAVGLVKSLLEQSGIDPQGFEETNKALVSLDPETTVLIAAEHRLIHLIGVVGPVAAVGQTLLRALLQENFKSIAQSRYRYSIEPQSGELLMSHSLQSDIIDGDAFIAAFVRMADYMGKWSGSLAGGATTVPEPEGAAASAAPAVEKAAFDPDSTSGLGFLRV